MDETIIKQLQDALRENKNDIVFLNQKDVIDKTGWCKNTVAEMFNRTDFPALELGKEKLVELGAFKEWAKKRRER